MKFISFLSALLVLTFIGCDNTRIIEEEETDILPSLEIDLNNDEIIDLEVFYQLTKVEKINLLL